MTDGDIGVSKRRSRIGRRQLLTAAGGASVALIAGCSARSSDGSTDRPVTETSTDTSKETAGTTRGTSRASGEDGTLSRAEILGATHAGEHNHFTEEDHLNEGAIRLEELGMRVKKTWCQDLEEHYPFDSEWPEGGFDSIEAVLDYEYFRELFDRQWFDSHVLLMYSRTPWGAAAGTNHWWNDAHQEAVTQKRYDEEVEQFYEGSKHLLETYDGTGKTFVFQNWEGDWAAIGGYDTNQEISQGTADRMARWWNARQEGVTKAREEVDSDVTVLHAAEVNLVPSAMDGTRRVINAAVPQTNVDMVSYSSWSLQGQLRSIGWENFTPDNPEAIKKGRTEITKTLDYIHDKAPEPDDYTKNALQGRKNVMLGEHGPKYGSGSLAGGTRMTRLMVGTGVDWGLRYAIFWQLYDTNEGNRLIDEDNNPTPAWSFYQDYLDGADAIGAGQTVTPSTPVPKQPDWSVSASNYSEQYNSFPVKAVDGNEASAWASGVGIPDNDIWLQVDLGSTQTLSGVTIEHAESGAYPAEITVEVSDSGTEWTPVTTVAGSQSVEAQFDTRETQVVRLSEDDTSTQAWWKIAEFDVVTA